MRHFDHARDVAGIDRVGVGWSGADLGMVWSGNILRVLRATDDRFAAQAQTALVGGQS